MRCEVARNLMSAYIDNEINQIEKKALEKHLSECTECREEYELLLEVVTGCSNIEEQELPQGFGEELHQMLENEKSSAGKNKKLLFFNLNNRWKMASGLVAAVLVLALALGGAYSYILDKKGLGTGNGEINYSVADQSAPMGDTASRGSTNASLRSAAPMAQEKKAKMNVTYNESFAAPAAPQAAPTADSTVGAGAAPDTNFTAENAQPETKGLLASRSMPEGRKVIKTGNITLKVVKLDAKMTDIKNLAEQNGGYVENSSVANVVVDAVNNPDSKDVTGSSTVKTANVTIRVPAQSFDTAFDTIKTMGTLDNENVNGSDITYQYRDTYTRVENLKIQEKRLLDLMTKAKNVDELLRIENELNRVRTDIEMMSGDLKRWDDLVDLSTIYINLTEVKEGELNKIDVPNVWSKAYKGFIGAINKIITGTEKLVVFIVTAIPYLIILGVVAAAAVLAARRIMAKRKSQK